MTYVHCYTSLYRYHSAYRGESSLIEHQWLELIGYPRFETGVITFPVFPYYCLLFLNSNLQCGSLQCEGLQHKVVLLVLLQDEPEAPEGGQLQ